MRIRRWVLATVVAGCGGGDGSNDASSGSTSVASTSSGTSSASTSVGTSTSGTSGSETGTTEVAETTAATDGPKFDVGGDDTGGELPPTFPTTCAEAAMSKTSVGCVFYPAALVGSQQQTAFVVNNVSSDMATVTLSDIFGMVEVTQVPPGGMHQFLDTGAHKMSSTTHVGDDGYVIESDWPLQVWQFMPPSSPPTADASIVLPEQALGVRHRVATYNTHSNNTAQYTAVIATEDDTEVTFTLAQPNSEVIAGGPIPTLDKNNGPDSATVTIDRLETVVLIGDPEYSQNMELNEFTGSELESTKPVAVYSGKQLANIPEGQCCADLIATAVPPTTVYGRQYAGVKFIPVGVEYDIWRLIGNVDGTDITLSGGVDMIVSVDAGEFVDVETAEVFWMSANEPFGAVHFMTAGWLANPDPDLQPYDCANPIQAPGDPAMGWVYPRGNWLNRYLFPVDVGGSWCHDHITVVAPLDRWDEIELDGVALPMAATQIGQTDHGFAYIQVPNPQHELIAPPDVGVEVSVYGFVHNGSYFYPGGMGLQDLNPEG